MEGVRKLGWRGGIALGGGLLLLVFLAGGFSAPSTDRPWKSGLERASRFAPAGAGAWRLENLRAFAFGGEGRVEKAWTEQEISAEDLREVWFFVEPFPGNAAFAHSYLSFVFGGTTDTAIAVSVEARMEEGESYSAFRGLLRAFELSYVWSTEKDIHTRIAVDLNHRLEAYKLTLEPHHARAILTHFIARTNDLAVRPRFYNTLFSNCTNELAKAVNDAFPGALPWHSSFVLTGNSARYLHEKGYLAPDAASFEAAQESADISGAVRAHQALAPAGFAAAWRARLGKGE